MHKREMPKNTDVTQYGRLLKLCDQYGYDSIVERLVTPLYGLVEQEPWEIFSIASSLDNIGLAKAALVVIKLD
jgi:hypothetical protein